ncbi:MAG: hypothetical protein AAFQ83_13755 [Bacteroidota bacterium]
MRIQFLKLGAATICWLLFAHLTVKAQVPLSQQKGTWSLGVGISQYTGVSELQYSPNLRLGYNVRDRWTLGLNYRGGDPFAFTDDIGLSVRTVELSIRRYIISGARLSLFMELGIGTQYSPFRDPLEGTFFVQERGRPLTGRMTPGIQAQLLPWLSLEGSMDFRTLYNLNTGEIRSATPGINVGLNIHLNKRRKR